MMMVPHIATAQLFMLALSACMVWVMISDASRYVISNAINGVVLALFVLAIFFLPVEPLSGLAAAVAVLVVGLGLFALGLMGGGDIKLLVALTFWTGWGMATLQFIFLTAICGGVLVIVVLLLRAIVPPILLKVNPTHTLPRLLVRKQPVPYGIAIAMAFLWLMWTGGIPALG